MVRLVGRAGGARSPVESVFVLLGIDMLEDSIELVYVTVDSIVVE